MKWGYDKYGIDQSGLDHVTGSDGVIDLAGLNLNSNPGRMGFQRLDLAGNAGDFYRVTLDTGNYFEVQRPTVSLVEDNGSSESDGTTSNATVQLNGSKVNEYFKYSLDGGLSWKNSQPVVTQTIAANEFELTPGIKTVDVIRVNGFGKESPITHFEFTLQPEEILGTPATDGNYTIFKGTNGLDHFVVKGSDGRGIHIAGYQAGDVIDLSQVLSVPADADIMKKLWASDATGNHVIGVWTGRASSTIGDQIGIQLDNFVPGTPVTILYDGGKVII